MGKHRIKHKGCPFCDKEISTHTQKCPFCGKYLHPRYKKLAKTERNKEVIKAVKRVENLKKKYKITKQRVSQIVRSYK